MKNSSFGLLSILDRLENHTVERLRKKEKRESDEFNYSLILKNRFNVENANASYV